MEEIDYKPKYKSEFNNGVHTYGGERYSTDKYWMRFGNLITNGYGQLVRSSSWSTCAGDITGKYLIFSDNPDILLDICIDEIKEHKFEKAQFYFDKALKEKPGDSYILELIGESYRESNRFKNAIPLYQQAIKTDLKDYWSYFNIVSCQLGLNEIEDALSELKHALKIAAEVKSTNQLIQTFEENLTTLFIYASQENISAYLTEALTLIEKYGYTDQFYKSIPETIFDILKEHDKIKIERFEFIEGYLNNKFKEDESMIIPLKFLNIGIRHLKKKEKNALLQFTKEERAIFKKFVLDKINFNMLRHNT